MVGLVGDGITCASYGVPGRPRSAANEFAQAISRWAPASCSSSVPCAELLAFTVKWQEYMPRTAEFSEIQPRTHCTRACPLP